MASSPEQGKQDSLQMHTNRGAPQSEQVTVKGEKGETLFGTGRGITATRSANDTLADL